MEEVGTSIKKITVPNPVTRTTSDPLDVHISTPGSNWDAIITCSNHDVLDYKSDTRKAQRRTKQPNRVFYKSRHCFLTIAYHGVVYANIFCVLNVNSICIWAEFGWRNCELIYLHSIAAIKFHVELRTILNF